MKKLAIATALGFLGMIAAASAETKVWQITEETDANIKYGQGTWKITRDGDKISGKAEVMDDLGNMTYYGLEGTVEGTNYTIKLLDRTDDKKNCVWKGHIPNQSGSQTKGLAGWGECDGKKIIIRAYE